MKLKNAEGETGKLLRVVIFSPLLFCCQTLAGPMGLPDSARPGAVRPQPEIPPEAIPSQASDVDIPALIDRPFDIEEGPYVVVEQFRLVDAEDLPEFDISTEEIQTLILDKFMREQPERGLSIGELQEVADEVTRYYRNKGLILSSAVIPVQTVSEGIVDIKIFIGRLGRVIAESNEGYSDSLLRRPFLELVGQPVSQKNIEAALLTLTEYPGLSVFGVFQPGRKVGETDIVLKVQEEKWYDVAYRADNHGLQETGRNRFRTVVDWNNPIDLADRLSFTFQQTYNPKNSYYWALDYQVYLGDNFTLSLGTFKNRFDIGGEFAEDNISTETSNYSIELNRSFILSRQQNLSGTLAFNRKVTTTMAAKEQTSTSRLAVLSLAVDYDLVDSYDPFRNLINLFRKEPDNNSGGGLNFLTVTLSRGFNDIFGAAGSSNNQSLLPASSRSSRLGNETGEFAAGQFTKLEVNYRRLQLMTKNQSLLFRTEFQWSKDILMPLEQYSVGGPENVRGFSDAQGLFDRAYFLSFEYIFNAPFIADRPAFLNRTWGELLQLSFFYDFVSAQQNDALNTEVDRNTSGKWVTYRSVGAGLRFNLPGAIDSRLMYSAGLGPEKPNNGRGGQIWGDFTYSF